VKQVVCLKWGDKYPADYVNRLYRMVSRQLGAPWRFHCVTDDATGLDPGIKHIDLPELGLNGWWNKMWLFSPDFPLRGRCIYLDLDVVIAAPINELVAFREDKPFCAIRDFVREEFNTSVICWQPHDPRILEIWRSFTAFRESVRRSRIEHLRRQLSYWRRRLAPKAKKRIGSASELSDLGPYKGDQRWLSEHLWGKDWAVAFPAGWCFSYKWGIHKASAPQDRHRPGQWLPDGKIAIFEGRPKPHDCLHVSWVANNWC
jgi:hypothetical protein